MQGSNAKIFGPDVWIHRAADSKMGSSFWCLWLLSLRFEDRKSLQPKKAKSFKHNCRTCSRRVNTVNTEEQGRLMKRTRFTMTHQLDPLCAFVGNLRAPGKTETCSGCATQIIVGSFHSIEITAVTFLDVSNDLQWPSVTSKRRAKI